MRIGYILLAGVAIYIALDPFRLSPIAEFPNFKAHRIETMPLSMVPTPHDHENLLQKADINTLIGINGPESIAFDLQNRGPYTGVADGRIMRWDGPLVGWSYFAHTSPNRSDICDKPRGSALAYVSSEHICGRPLGLRFHKTGDLYIADAYFGLLVVGPQGGLATPLTHKAEGIPLKFTNDLDVDDDGNVYFTDSSSNYQRKNFLQLIFSAENTGRVLKYDHHTKRTQVLLRDAYFPNGLSLSNDGLYFVFAETVTGRLLRHWLKGQRAGTTDLVTTLPGYPDNVRVNQKGEIWVAIHARFNRLAFFLASHTSIRAFILKLPIPAKLQYIAYIGGRLHGMVTKYSPEGKLLQVLEDKTGKVVKAVSEVEERDNKLWMGSVISNNIAVY
eukprot:TRINITY_DN17201_c0_g1_i1.p1 TRINITY_DN17201_c0_g1~~TRINITY_DN17201_c0_g1_i1.p1  ORF type:complete len:388 (+),score=58.73 TRINITY_DN17201_c0_g1_i1:408-1571(+)